MEGRYNTRNAKRRNNGRGRTTTPMDRVRTILTNVRGTIEVLRSSAEGVVQDVTLSGMPVSYLQIYARLQEENGGRSGEQLEAAALVLTNLICTRDDRPVTDRTSTWEWGPHFHSTPLGEVDFSSDSTPLSEGDFGVEASSSETRSGSSSPQASSASPQVPVEGSRAAVSSSSSSSSGNVSESPSNRYEKTPENQEERTDPQEDSMPELTTSEDSAGDSGEDDHAALREERTDSQEHSTPELTSS